MGEIYLSEEDEARLKRAAIDNVFLAFLALQVKQSPDPAGFLKNIEEMALDLSRAGRHSDDLETNKYSRNYVFKLVEAYIGQIRLEASTK